MVAILSLIVGILSLVSMPIGGYYAWKNFDKIKWSILARTFGYDPTDVPRPYDPDNPNPAPTPPPEPRRPWLPWRR